MNCRYLILIIVSVLSGCQEPSRPTVPAGLKITDIQDTSLKLKEAEFLISFRILRYEVDPNSLNALDSVFEESKDEIHFQDIQAFTSNGFAAALIPHDRGGGIARALNEAGAVRTGQSLLANPPATTEIMSSVPLNQQQSIKFLASYDRIVSHTFLPGYIGWTLFADSSIIRDTAVIKIVPAYWQIGAEDIRTKLGQPPVDFKNFEVAGFQTRLREGDLIFLAPTQILEEGTLNRALFLQAARRPQAKCFVIICESAGL